MMLRAAIAWLLLLRIAALSVSAATAYSDSPVVVLRACPNSTATCFLLPYDGRSTSLYNTVVSSSYIANTRGQWIASWSGASNSNTNRFCLRVDDDAMTTRPRFLSGGAAALSYTCDTTWALPTITVTINGVAVSWTVQTAVALTHAVAGDASPSYIGASIVSGFGNFVSRWTVHTPFTQWVPIPLTGTISAGQSFCLYSNKGLLGTAYDSTIGQQTVNWVNGTSANCSMTSGTVWRLDGSGCLGSSGNPAYYLEYKTSGDYYQSISQTCKMPIAWTTTNLILAAYTYTVFTTLYSPNPADPAIVSILNTANSTRNPVWEVAVQGALLPLVVQRLAGTGQCFQSSAFKTAMACGRRSNSSFVCPTVTSNCTTPSSAAIVPAAAELSCSDCDSCRPSYSTSVSGYYLGTIILYAVLLIVCIFLMVTLKAGLLDIQRSARIRVAFGVGLVTDIWEWGLCVRAYLLMKDWLDSYRGFPVTCGQSANMAICALGTDSSDASVISTLLGVGVALYLVTIIIFSLLRYGLERLKARSNVDKEEATLMTLAGAFLSCARLGFGPVTKYLAGISLDSDCLNQNLQGSHDDLLYFCIFGGILLVVLIVIIIGFSVAQCCSEEDETLTEEERDQKEDEVVSRVVAIISASLTIILLYLFAWGVYELYQASQSFSISFFFAQFFSIWAITPTIQIPYALLSAMSSSAGKGATSGAREPFGTTAAKQGLKATSKGLNRKSKHDKDEEEEDEDQRNRD